MQQVKNYFRTSRLRLPGRIVFYSLIFVSGFIVMSYTIDKGSRSGRTTTVRDISSERVPVDPDHKIFAFKKDSIASVRAFRDVYKVLMSPRCMNCHPSGDTPLQGDDNHPHVMAPQRGKDGKGVLAMKCANCHQPENVPGPNTPPGNPNWHLPPADMKMVFQGKTAAQLAKQLVNPQTNGHKNLEQLLEHMHDTLVVAGWNPGEGRTLPPLSYDEFKKAWSAWITNGAYAPR